MLIKESPVGTVGRTTKEEAIEHIENSDLAKKFRKIVKELGGKTVARQLLSTMTPSGNYVSKPTEKTNTDKITEGIENTPPQDYLRKVGFKIKDEDFDKNIIKLTFYKQSDVDMAIDDLSTIGYDKFYKITSKGKELDLIEL